MQCAKISQKFRCVRFFLLFKNFQSISFEISVPPKLSSLSDLSEPLFMDEFFQIYCSVLHGDFPISFTWLHKNETIVGSENVRIEFTKRSSILSIESVSGEDAGQYTCVASNRAGATNLSTTLIVKGQSENIFS